VDIKITCRACERTFPLQMAVDAEARPGYCPFCGEVLAFNYSGTFIETSQRVLALGTEFARQLTLLAELAGGFAIEKESVLTAVRDALGQQDVRVAEPYRPGWPPQPSEPLA
jgi:hypothetical protein